MRASRTNALSSQLCQSSSSSRAEVSAASVTFRVASLQRRSIKPGIFTRVTEERSHDTVKCIVLFYILCGLTAVVFSNPGCSRHVMGMCWSFAGYCGPGECVCHLHPHLALIWWLRGYDRSWPAAAGWSSGPDWPSWEFLQAGWFPKIKTAKKVIYLRFR